MFDCFQMPNEYKYNDEFEMWVEYLIVVLNDFQSLLRILHFLLATKIYYTLHKQITISIFDNLPSKSEAYILICTNPCMKSIFIFFLHMNVCIDGRKFHVLLDLGETFCF